MIEPKLQRFYDALQRDGAAGEILGALINIANLIPLHATGSIVYTLNIELRNIREYYSLDIELKFNRDLRNSRILEARKITLDEYIGVHWRDEKDFREAYYQLLKLIKK